MSELAALMSANLRDVFGQRDEAARRAAMAQIFADDIRFADHNGVVVGFEGVNAAIQALQDSTPGFVFSEAGPVHEVQDLGTVAWNYGPPDAAPVVSGTDVVLVAEGRIASLWVYLTSS